MPLVRSPSTCMGWGRSSAALPARACSSALCRQRGATGWICRVCAFFRSTWRSSHLLRNSAYVGSDDGRPGGTTHDDRRREPGGRLRAVSVGRRCARGVRGSLSFEMVCKPAFNYARDTHRVYLSEGGAVFNDESLCLGLSSPVPLEEDGDGGVRATFTLHEGQSVHFLLQSASDEPPGDHGRDTQLGLPLYLAARFGFYTLQLTLAWLHYGGKGIYGLAGRTLPRIGR